MKLYTLFFLFFCLALQGCADEKQKQVTSSIPSPDQPHKRMERTDGFDYPYEYSFYYDYCGQPQLGKALRKALIEKVNSCPFSDIAKQHFIHAAADSEIKVQSEISKYLKIHGKYPTYLKGAKMDCAMIFDKRALDGNKQLMLYDRGDIKFDQIIKSSCDKGGSTFSNL
jgi:hypothetical protein